MSTRDFEIYYTLSGRGNRTPVPTRIRQTWLDWFNDVRTVRRVELTDIGGPKNTFVSTVFFGVASVLFETAVITDVEDEFGVPQAVKVTSIVAQTWDEALGEHQDTIERWQSRADEETARAVGVDGHVVGR